MVTCQAHHTAMPMTNPRLSSSSSAWAVSWSTPRPSSNGLSTGTPDVRLWETPVAETVHLPNMGKNCNEWQSWIRHKKTVILGDFRHNTTTNSIWNDQENTWPGGSWEFVEKIFSIWRHENGHEKQGKNQHVAAPILQSSIALQQFRASILVFQQSLSHIYLWECMALSTGQGTLSESALDIHGQQPAIRHLCWQKKVRCRERIRCENANIVYACYRSFWLVSKM